MSENTRFGWAVIGAIALIGLLAFASILDLHLRATQTHELILKCMEKDTTTNCAAAFKKGE